MTLLDHKLAQQRQVLPPELRPTQYQIQPNRWFDPVQCRCGASAQYITNYTAAAGQTKITLL